MPITRTQPNRPEVSRLRLSREFRHADSRPDTKGLGILPRPFVYSFRTDRLNCFEDRLRFHHRDGGAGDGDCCCSAADVQRHKQSLRLPLVPGPHQRG